MASANRKSTREVQHVLSEMWAPARTGSVVEWVENNVELPTGAITGKISMRMIPYAREPLERFGDKTCRHLVLVSPTQAAKTTILICGLLYRIAVDPEDAMLVFGNADQARDISKERLQPFVLRCKPVADLIPRTSTGVINKHLWGFTSQHYSSMVVNLVGAGSTTNLSSRPRGLIILDECDKYYDQLSFDAGTIQLAEERQKTFHFPLAVKASSPTLANRMIWVEFLKSDQRYYFVPCPRCGEEILFRFSIQSDLHGDCGVRWWHNHEDEAKTDGAWDFAKVRALAHYKCQKCGGMIHDFEREGMLQEGVWRPQNPLAESGRRGYHLNSIYSILSQQTSLAQIAIQFLLAKGLRSELQNFVNGWLGEPWDEAQLYEHREVKLKAFTNADIPKDSTVPFMAIDVQEVGYWVLVRRFQPPTPELPNGQSWLLFADFVHTEEELVEIQEEYGVEGQHVTADMAKRPNQVARMILKHDWRGIWGTDTKEFMHPTDNGTKVGRPFSVVQFRDPMLGTSWENRSFERARFVKFSKPGALDMVASLRYAEPAIWHCTVNVNPKYSSHLNSRVKRQQKNKRTGRVEFVWHELSQNNHLADCENHVTIQAMMAGLLSLPNESDKSNVA